jgi:hypothetical protein
MRRQGSSVTTSTRSAPARPIQSRNATSAADSSAVESSMVVSSPLTTPGLARRQRPSADPWLGRAGLPGLKRPVVVPTPAASPRPAPLPALAGSLPITYRALAEARPDDD